MISEIIGMPGSGKSTVTRLLTKKLEHLSPIGKYDKGVKRLIDKTNLRERFEDRYPGAWEAYEEALKYYTIDNTPESPEEWRKKAFEKHTDQMALHLAMTERDSLFIWNKGITQVPLEVLQASSLDPESKEFKRIARVVDLWPISELIIEIRVNEDFGAMRYISRRIAKMKRPGPRGEKSRKYPGWSPELYSRNWRIWDKYAERMARRTSGVWKMLPNNYLELSRLEESRLFEVAMRQICILT